MCRFVVGSLVVLFTVLRADANPQSQPQTPADQYRALVQGQRDAQKRFAEAYKAADTEEQRKQVLQELGVKADPQSHATDFLALITNDPDDPVALDAFLWLVANARNSRATREAQQALTADLLRSEAMVQVCRSLFHYPCEASAQLLYRALGANPNHRVQGYARYSLVQHYQRQSARRNLPAAKRSAAAENAIRLLEEIVADYGDLEFNRSTLGELVEPELFELRNLAIGKVAPEIRREDIQGKPMNLSDYRGKVVLLVFSGFTWCAACRASLPHEKSLVDRLEGRPFALVGVYSEQDREWLRTFMEDQSITWRAWWDGPTQDGPIATRWNVHSWPIMYLLDADGVIRYKGDDLRGIKARLDERGKVQQVHVLDELVERLLDETPVRK